MLCLLHASKNMNNQIDTRIHLSSFELHVLYNVLIYRLSHAKTFFVQYLAIIWPTKMEELFDFLMGKTTQFPAIFHISFFPWICLLLFVGPSSKHLSS